MAQMWDAERRVEPELARRLIREQVPGLAAAQVERLGEGWDNVVYRVDEEWVFRFPRRQLGANLLATEVAVLPRIAGQLPLPVPVPVHVGAPSPDYPWRFSGCRFLAGRTACRASLTPERRLALAPALGEFLARLHAIPTAELDVRGDTLCRMNLESRLPQLLERLDKLDGLGLIGSPEPWRRLLTDLPRGIRTACLVHGDLYARHLLVDEAGRLCGVIDWGDTHLGDPAADLMIAYSLLPPATRAAFQHAYGPADPETWRLARLRAVFHTTILALYAHDVGDADLLAEALRGLAWIVEEESL